MDIIIGNDKKHELVELIENCMNQKKNANEETEGVDDWKENICDINEKGRAYEALSISRTEEHTRAFLKGAGWLQPVLHILYYSICER